MALPPRAVWLAGFQFADPAAELSVLRPQFSLVGAPPGVGAQPRIVLPPVDADLPGGLQRGDDQPELDGEQLDVEQVDLDVARDHQALVQDALEDVAEVGGRASTAGPVELG